MKRILFAAALADATAAALAGDSKDHAGIGVTPVTAHTSPV